MEPRIQYAQTAAGVSIAYATVREVRIAPAEKGEGGWLIS